MPSQSLLRSLDFTRAAGRRVHDQDTVFNDAVSVGRFPTDQRILRIKRITLFGDNAGDNAVIVGLIVIYMVGTERPYEVVATHGIVTGPRVAIVELNENQILVGAGGKLKNLPEDPNRNRRISFMTLNVYDKGTGSAPLLGPFGSTTNVGDSWGSYGPIIAFHGTLSAEHGLTSLGFAKLIQGAPHLGIAEN